MMSEEIKTCGECDNWEPLFCGRGKCSENRNPDSKYGKLVPACEKFTPKKELNGNKNQIPKGFIEVTAISDGECYRLLVNVISILTVFDREGTHFSIIGIPDVTRIQESYETIIERIKEAQK